jgi:hypothetical protein
MASAKDSGGFGRSFNAAGQFGRGGAPGGAGRATGRGVPNSSRGMNQAEVKAAKKAVARSKEYENKTAPAYDRGSGNIKVRGTSSSDSRAGKLARNSGNNYKTQSAKSDKSAVKSGKSPNTYRSPTNSARMPSAKVKPSSGRMSPRSTGK